ncbi:RNase H domain-containing protein [Trichonephila clavipes]|nr:RNase H domain-containing protein [Trichonephila clavipes]
MEVNFFPFLAIATDKLEPIYNAALRLALGLPRNSPLDLLRAESMNGSTNNRHNFLCQKFIIKQIALKNWSPNARLFWDINNIFYKYREKEISIFQKTINLLQELCNSKVDILQWIPPPPPIYENRKINIYTQELPFQNKDLPDDIVQNMFNDYIKPKFNNNIIIATDGSKNTNQTSIGILIPKKKVRQNFMLKEMISIFRAEAIAIWTALKNWVSETENYVILTDSLSVLKSIQSINRKSNTIILNLSSTLHQCLQIAQSITFIWVPAHKGIGINEVDKLAKASPEPWNIISWITWEDLHAHFKKQQK